MPKSIEVLPNRLSQQGELTVPVIPLYQYQTTVMEERAERGDETLTRVLRHMMIIREFETMLNALRSTGEFAGISCPYRGPAHLSVGQEAAAVGMALSLDPHDHVFGSHRSHGEFLAKGLAAINTLSDNELGNIMMSQAEGHLLRVIENRFDSATNSLPENFLLFGFLSEILMRSCGFNKGMGGSMHAFFLPFGSYPNNAIVGGSAGIATGAALHKRKTQEGIAVSITGDGSTGCGAVLEAMNFAAMGQIDSLWHDQPDSGLPVLFLFTNNFYAMGGQTIGETMSWDRLARIGLGVNAKALHAETVDGTNPLAVADAVRRKRELLNAGGGPALLDIECYRYSGHSTSDANVYRSREEMKAWQAHDGIERYALTLFDAGIVSESEVTDMREDVREQIVKIVELAANPTAAPVIDIAANPALIGDLMFNHSSIDINDLKTGAAIEEEFDLLSCSRLRQNAKKSRTAMDDSGKPLSPMRATTLRDGLFESILHHMLRDDRLVIYGEECREWGGAFGVYRGLSDLFPPDRVFNSPISEATIVSSAVGYAMEGGRALVELMYADFIGRAGDEIFNQLSKWQAMSGGELELPVVLRCSVGSKYGAQHSQDWSSLVTHVPGLKVVYPASPIDAKGLMASALASNDPIVVFESQRLYDYTERFSLEGVPAEYFETPIGVPDVKLSGTDVTVLTIGPSLYPAMEAANTLIETFGVQAEIVDARSLVPFDYEPLLASIEKTGHLLIVSEACERGSFANTLAASASRFAFANLKSAPQVLGAPNWIVPGAEMESTYFPSSTDIVDRVMQAFFPEKSSEPSGVRQWNDLKLAKVGL